MNRRTSLFVAVLVAVVLVGMVPLGAAVTDDLAADADDPDGERNETGSDLKPGERFSGVVGVQQAELEGEVENRAFGLRLADAETDAERAAVVADQLDRNERRLEAVSDRRNELRDRRATGEMSEGAYAARTARIGAEVESVKRTTDRSAEAAETLPDGVLQERSVSAERVDALRDRASSLSGPEVAEMAREIGGNRTGAPMGPPHEGGPGAGIGPPGDDTDAHGPGGGAETAVGGSTGAPNGTHPGGEPAGNDPDAGGSAGNGERHEGSPDGTDGTAGGDADDTAGGDAGDTAGDGTDGTAGGDADDATAGDGADGSASDGEGADGSGSSGAALVSPTGASVDRQ